MDQTEKNKRWAEMMADCARIDAYRPRTPGQSRRGSLAEEGAAALAAFAAHDKGKGPSRPDPRPEVGVPRGGAGPQHYAKAALALHDQARNRTNEANLSHGWASVGEAREAHEMAAKAHDRAAKAMHEIGAHQTAGEHERVAGEHRKAAAVQGERESAAQRQGVLGSHGRVASLKSPDAPGAEEHNARVASVPRSVEVGEWDESKHPRDENGKFA